MTTEKNDRNVLPRDYGTLLYRWSRPPLPPETLNLIGTPTEYAVFRLDPEEGRSVDLGDCIIFGWYESRGEWLANPSERALVMHLLTRCGEVK